MKILLLVDSLSSGGMQRRLIELIKGLRNYSDVQLQLVVFSDKIHYKEVFDLGIPVQILKRVPKRNPKVFYRLYKLCKSWKPDLIHSWGTMSALLAIPSSQLLGIKLINGNVVDAPKDMGFFDERLFRARLTFFFSTVIIGNSEAGLRAYKVPKLKGICIYNGFDSNRVSNLDQKSIVKEQFHINTEKVIGMVGGFYDRKDFETYILAGLQILGQRNDVTFVAVGDGPNLEKCRAMIPSEYSSTFIFTGVQRDIESIVNIFDVGVLSTNTDVHGEGISNAILEYMALGKPVVATYGGGTDEVVVHNTTGLLVLPKSPNEMTKCLVKLLDDTDRAHKMGEEGKDRVVNFFGLRKMTKSYLELYQNTLST